MKMSLNIFQKQVSFISKYSNLTTALEIIFVYIKGIIQRHQMIFDIDFKMHLFKFKKCYTK